MHATTVSGPSKKVSKTVSKTVSNVGRALVAVCACGAVSGCGGDGKGSVVLFVEAEETITEGLMPGTGLENIKDGWTVTYSKFVIGLGNVRIGKSADAKATLTDATVQVIDLRSLPSTGLILARWTGIAEGRWDQVGYDQAYATASAVAAVGTAPADLSTMVTAGASLLVAGTITKDARTIAFDWPLRAGVAWSDCGPEMGDTGIAVPSGGTAQVKATMHGDHWFFNNFPEGGESTVRRAEWVATVDSMTGGDGSVSVADLAAVPASALFPAGTYSLSNPLDDIIGTALDYVVTQARTIGHLDGEGECASLRKL